MTMFSQQEAFTVPEINGVEVSSEEAVMVAKLFDEGTVSDFDGAMKALEASRKFDAKIGISAPAVSASASGGMTDNMPPRKPQGNTPQNPYWCGSDWLTLNFQVKFLEWTKIHPLFDTPAMAALEQRKPIDCADLGGAVMQPGGGSIGKGAGKSGKYCKYRMTLDFGTVLIAENETYAGTWPNVQIHIPGEICLVYRGGADEAYNDAIKWLESLDVQIDKEMISRVDACADFPGWSMDYFVSAFVGRKWRCRANSLDFQKSNSMTLYWGNNPLRLRIYDKLGEMEAKALRGEPIRFEHMIKKRWGGERPESAVRVEYQISRDKLREWGIDSYADWKAKGGAVLGYLTGARDDPMFCQKSKRMKIMRWFRFLTKRRNVKHPEKDRTSVKWKIVQDTFSRNFGAPEPLVIVEPDNADVEALIKQAFGVLEAAAWNKGFVIPKRPVTNESKYSFRNYDQFESWVLGMLRVVALGKDGWKFDLKWGDPRTVDEVFEQIMKDKAERFAERERKKSMEQKYMEAQEREFRKKYRRLHDEGKHEEAHAVWQEWNDIKKGYDDGEL